MNTVDSWKYTTSLTIGNVKRLSSLKGMSKPFAGLKKQKTRFINLMILVEDLNKSTL